MLAVLTTYIQGVCNICVVEENGSLLFTSLSSLTGKKTTAHVCGGGRKSRKGNTGALANQTRT